MRNNHLGSYLLLSMPSRKFRPDFRKRILRPSVLMMYELVWVDLCTSCHVQRRMFDRMGCGLVCADGFNSTEIRCAAKVVFHSSLTILPKHVCIGIYVGVHSRDVFHKTIIKLSYHIELQTDLIAFSTENDSYLFFGLYSRSCGVHFIRSFK